MWVGPIRIFFVFGTFLLWDPEGRGGRFLGSAGLGRSALLVAQEPL